MNHETMWSYTTPHISLCSAPTSAHMHSCHVHNMYPPPQIVPQQFSGCFPPPPHQGYAGFATPPNTLPVNSQHYTQQHIPTQVNVKNNYKN